ncbi:MAG: hypothetical protein AAF409_12965 [Pseudomonadota bacterium]
MEYTWDEGEALDSNYEFNLPYLSYIDTRSVSNAQATLFDMAGFLEALQRALEGADPAAGGPERSLEVLVGLFDLLRPAKVQFEGSIEALLGEWGRDATGPYIGSFLPNEIVADFQGNDAGDEAATAPTAQSFQSRVEALAAQAGSDNVALGIVDVGIAFVNARFRVTDPDGGPEDRTRFEMVWLQDRIFVDPGRRNNTLPFPICGTLLLRDDIDALIREFWRDGRLDEDAVYRLFTPTRPWAERDVMAMRQQHGTQVLDLMAGYRRGDKDMEPEAKRRRIYAVDLPARVIAETSGAFTSPFLLWGVWMISLVSLSLRGQNGRRAPLVLNLSLAYSLGPHDGSHPMVRGLDDLLEVSKLGGLREVRCVVPTGNHLQDRLHALIASDKWTGGACTLTWQLLPDDRSGSFVEIWSTSCGDFGSNAGRPPERVSLVPPDSEGEPIDLPADPLLDHVYRLRCKDGNEVAAIFYLRHTGRHSTAPRVVVAVRPTATYGAGIVTAPAGRWKITLTKREAADHAEVDLWIARDDTIEGLRSYGRQSFFVDHEYRRFTPLGDVARDDRREALIRRMGTRSVLATGVETLKEGGLEMTREPGASHGTRPYRLGGQPVESTELRAVNDEGRSTGGVLAAGRSGRSVATFSGTSAASAIRARAEADAIQSTAPLPTEPIKGRRPRRIFMKRT